MLILAVVLVAQTGSSPPAWVEAIDIYFERVSLTDRDAPLDERITKENLLGRSVHIAIYAAAKDFQIITCKRSYAV